MFTQQERDRLNARLQDDTPEGRAIRRRHVQQKIQYIILALFVYAGFFAVLIVAIVLVPSPWKILIIPALAAAWMFMIKT